MPDCIKEQANSEYQGISKFHQNGETPKRKSKERELTDDEKKKTNVFHMNVFLLKTSMLRSKFLR